MSVSIPSTSTTVEEELSKSKELDLKKKFFVKNVPSDWDDWRVFHVFNRLGLVENVRLGKTLHIGFRNAFVDMLDFEGADSVRAILSNGRFLKEDGANLIVESQRSELTAATSTDNKENINPNSPPSSGVTKSPFVRNQSGNLRPQKKWNTSTPEQKTANIQHRDLPLRKELTIVIVDSPSDMTEENEEDFDFFVRPKEMTDPKYTSMQQNMNAYINCRPPDGSNCKAGDCVFVQIKGTGFRARLLGNDKAYLLDFGQEVIVTDTWRIPDTPTAASSHFHLPAFVSRCRLHNVKLVDSSARTKVLNMLKTMREKEGCTMFVTQRGFSGRTNLVQLRLEYVTPGAREVLDFAVGLTDRNLATYLEGGNETFAYTRDELNTLKRQCNLQYPPALLPFKDELGVNLTKVMGSLQV